MVDINWVQVGVGFVIGVFSSWLVSDLVFLVTNSEEKNDN